MTTDAQQLWIRSVVEALKADLQEARADARRDAKGTSGLYYWTGYADGLQLAVHVLETAHLQPMLPMR